MSTKDPLLQGIVCNVNQFNTEKISIKVICNGIIIKGNLISEKTYKKELEKTLKGIDRH